MVDVQNGVPFLSRLVTRAPGRRARAPRAPRAVAGRLRPGGARGSAGGWSRGWRRGSTARCRTSTVSRGHPARAGRPRRRRASASRSCTTAPRPGPSRTRPRRQRPRSVVAGPAGAAQAGWSTPSTSSPGWPPRHDVQLDVVGHGYWEDEIRRYAGELGRRRPGALARLRRRRPQARAAVGVLGARLPVAQGGLGAGVRRGGEARRADRGLPLGRRGRRVGAGRRGPGCWSTTLDGDGRPGQDADSRTPTCGARMGQQAREFARAATRGTRRPGGSRRCWTRRRAGWFSARRRRRAACRPGPGSGSASRDEAEGRADGQGDGHHAGDHQHLPADPSDSLSATTVRRA